MILLLCAPTIYELEGRSDSLGTRVDACTVIASDDSIRFMMQLQSPIQLHMAIHCNDCFLMADM